ncbi:MAG: histidine phosphatase family protein [Natronosporangium sp.]
MTITTELVIARHGEAVCNTTGTVGGDRGCTGLTHSGRQQTHLLAGRLAAEHGDWPYDALYTTPRLRVRQTADIIATRLGLTATIEPDLRGPDHGDADGKQWHDVKTAFGGPSQHEPDRPYAQGSETWNQYLKRATTTLRTILDRYHGLRILIVGHGETIEAAHTLLLDLPAGACHRRGFVTDHACLTRWQQHVNRFGRRVWMLAAHNDTAHIARVREHHDRR